MGKSYKNKPEDRDIRTRKTPVYDRRSRREIDREVRHKILAYDKYRYLDTDEDDFEEEEY
jgi:hypothetical protein